MASSPRATDTERHGRGMLRHGPTRSDRVLVHARVPRSSFLYVIQQCSRTYDARLLHMCHDLHMRRRAQQRTGHRLYPQKRKLNTRCASPRAGLPSRPAHVEHSYDAIAVVVQNHSDRSDVKGTGATRSDTERHGATCQRRMSTMLLTLRNWAYPPTLHEAPTSVALHAHLGEHCAKSGLHETREEYGVCSCEYDRTQ